MRMQEGQAVLRQPHHLHRQHDDARQRDPARDAAGRGRRVQHRGAEVQRQAAQSARLLQGARRAGKDVDVQKTPNETNKVDVKLKLEEQNRNQLTFGAGVSQFEGFFGQLSFQTANFLGRGESLTLSLQAGSRAQNYSLAFTEPFLFDRNITGGVNLFKADVRYIGQFTQKSTGGVAHDRVPAGSGFTRMFTNYSYERVRVTEIDRRLPATRWCCARNPFLRDSLLHRQRRRAHHQQGRAEPRPQHGRQADLPDHRQAVHASIDLAGLGGNTNFYKPMVEGVWFLQAEQPR